MRGRRRWEACWNAKSSTSPECSPRSTPASTPRRTRARWWRGTTTTGTRSACRDCGIDTPALDDSGQTAGVCADDRKGGPAAQLEERGDGLGGCHQRVQVQVRMGATYDARSRRQEPLGALTFARHSDCGARGGGRHGDEDERATLEGRLLGGPGPRGLVGRGLVDVQDDRVVGDRLGRRDCRSALMLRPCAAAARPAKVRGPDPTGRWPRACLSSGRRRRRLLRRVVALVVLGGLRLDHHQHGLVGGVLVGLLEQRVFNRALLVSCCTWNVTVPSGPRRPVARVTFWPSRRPMRGGTTLPGRPPCADATRAARCRR